MQTAHKLTGLISVSAGEEGAWGWGGGASGEQAQLTQAGPDNPVTWRPQTPGDGTHEAGRVQGQGAFWRQGLAVGRGKGAG